MGKRYVEPAAQIGLSCIAGALIYAVLIEFWNEGVVDSIKDFQALIAGILAVVVGGLTVRAMRDQTAQQREAEEIRLHRRNRAARAALALSLSNLCDYAERCIKSLVNLRSTATVSDGWIGFVPATIEMPQFSPEDRRAIEVCIEVGEAGPASALTELLVKLQIQNSRLSSFLDESVNPDGSTVDWFDTLVVDAVEVYGRLSSAFKYARLESEEIIRTPPRSSLSSALNRIADPNVDMKSAFRKIDKYFAG